MAERLNAVTSNAAHGSHAVAGLLPRSAPAPGTTAKVYEPVHIAAGYGRRDYNLRRMLAGADALAILGAIVLASILPGTDFSANDVLLGALTLPVWLVILNAYGLYRRDAKRVSHMTIDDVPWLFHAILVGSLGLWAYYRVLGDDQLVFAQVIAFGAAALVLTTALRMTVRRVETTILGPERVLLIGDHQATNLLSKIRAHPEYGLEPVGVLFHEGLNSHPLSLPIVATNDDLDFERVVHAYRVERVMVSKTELDEDVILELMRECRRLRLKVSILPELFDVMGPSVEVDDVEGVTVLGINPPVLTRSERVTKRALDMVVAGALLTIAAPLMAIIAIAIKLDSSGPVLFRQARVGRCSRVFRVCKFRTMCVDAEAQRAEVCDPNDPNWWKRDDDPRVTRVGKLLRATSLDELPQLFNVVAGQMSLVGPRPLPEAEDRMVEGWGRGRLDLTPGISGQWQVLGRADIPFGEMVKLDYLYVTNWSLWGDIRLMCKTLPAVVGRRGAN